MLEEGDVCWMEEELVVGTSVKEKMEGVDRSEGVLK